MNLGCLENTGVELNLDSFHKPLTHTSEGLLIGAMQRLTHRQLEFIDKMGSVVRQGLGISEEAEIPKPSRYRLPPSKRPRDGTESDLDETPESALKRATGDGSKLAGE